MVGNRGKCALIKVNAGNLWICGKPGCAPRSTLIYKHGQVIMTLRMCIVHRARRYLSFRQILFPSVLLIMPEKKRHMFQAWLEKYTQTCMSVYLSLRIIVDLDNIFCRSNHFLNVYKLISIFMHKSVITIW